MLRVLAPVVWLAGFVSLVAGCGSAGSAEQHTALPVSPQAWAYARAVNLRASDVPGMAVESEATATPRGVPLGALDRCLGGFGGSDLADAPMLSAWFTVPRPENSWHRRSHTSKLLMPPGELLYSEVDVMRDVAMARREAAALGGRSARLCVQADPVTSHGKPPISHAKVYPLPDARAELPVTGLRLDGILPEVGHTSYAFSSDIVAMASGRSVIVLHVTAWRRAFPAATARRLLLLLIRRASEHQA